MLSLLDKLEQSLRRGQSARPRPKSSGERLRRGEALGPAVALQIAGYRVEQTNFGDFLVEERAGAGHSFRCPKKVFDAVVEALAEAGRETQNYDEVMAAVEERFGKKPADYAIRMCLRFLTTKNLVARVRSKVLRLGASDIWRRSKSPLERAPRRASPRPGGAAIACDVDGMESRAVRVP